MRGTAFGTALALLLAGGGCGGGAKHAAVDHGKAKAALLGALDAWKRGDPPAALANATPPVTVQDMDWLAGRKLVGYELVGDPKDDTSSLRCAVKLQLEGADGKTAAKTVTYQVGTSPVTTVFREFSM